MTPPIRTFLCWSSFCLALLCQVGRAGADPTADFNHHVARAKELHHQHKYEAAIKEQELAYAIEQRPDLLYAMGQDSRLLGKSKEAAVYYRLYLKAQPELPDDLKSEIEGRIAEMDKLAQAQDNARRAPVFHEVRQPRQKWRLAAGGAAIGVGAVVLGFGISALVVNGSDIGQPVAPMQFTKQVYTTSGIGGALVGVGAVLMAAGSVVIAIPGEKHMVEVAAALSADSAAGLRLAATF